MIGALCASGVPPWFMVAHSRGEMFDGVVDARGPSGRGRRPRRRRAVSSWARTWPPIGPGSWRLALRTLANPRRYTPATVAERMDSARDLLHRVAARDTIRRVVPSGWSPHPNLLGRRLRLRDGAASGLRTHRRPRGRAGRCGHRLLRHPGDLPPGHDRRAPLRRRRHLLGVELDLLRGEGARPGHLPQPDLHPPPDPGDQPSRAAATSRCEHASGRRLGSEAKKLRAARHRGGSDPAASEDLWRWANLDEPPAVETR